MLWISASTRNAESPESISREGISLIIPFRDESKNLTDLIACLENLNLDVSDEVILVDDQSTVSIKEVVSHLAPSVKLIEIEKGIISSKKHALTRAILEAKNEWVLTTDADCIFSESWLHTKRKGIQPHNCDMILSPVSGMAVEMGFFSLISHIELLVLQTITKAAVNNNIPFLANGANLLFRKSAWEKVGRYNSHLQLASGDDVLLMNSFKAAGLKIVYHDDAEATVITKIRNKRNDWFSQHLRWASKTKHLSGFNEYLHAVFFLLWMINLLPGMMVFGPMYALVIIPELLLLRLFAPIQMNANDALFWPVFRVLYPAMVIFIMILSVSNSRNYWKGRPVNQSA